MDGKGRFLDNIFIERLWRSLKYEEVFIKVYTSVGEARGGISRWVAFYNGRVHLCKTRHTPGYASSDRVDAAQAGCDRHNRDGSPGTRASNRHDDQPRPVAPEPDWRGSRHHPAACSGASVAAARADRPPCRNSAAGEPGHAAGMPGRMTRTADTPSRPLRAQNQREASVTPSVGDNRRDVHPNIIGSNQVRGSIPLSDGGSFVVSAEARWDRYGQPDIFNTDQGVQFTSGDFIAMCVRTRLSVIANATRNVRGRADLWGTATATKGFSCQPECAIYMASLPPSHG